MSEQEIIIESNDSLELNIENFNKYMGLKLKFFENNYNHNNSDIITRIQEIELKYTKGVASDVYSANNIIKQLIPLYESILYQN